MVDNSSEMTLMLSEMSTNCRDIKTFSNIMLLVDQWNASENRFDESSLRNQVYKKFCLCGLRV